MEDIRFLHRVSGHLLMKITPIPSNNKQNFKQVVHIYSEKVPKEVQANQHQLDNTEAIQLPPDLLDELQRIEDVPEPENPLVQEQDLAPKSTQPFIDLASDAELEDFITSKVSQH